MKNVAIIGCGLIGQKRARQLKKAKLIACADIVPEKAEAIAKHHLNCLSTENWQDIINRKEVDIVIVSTINAALAPKLH